jgi:hypothetical protein
MASTSVKLKVIEYEPYNEAEQRLFEMIPLAPDRIDSKSLTKNFYKGLRKKPRFEQNTIIALVNTLQWKVEQNREPFRVIKSEPRGPHPIEVWVEEQRQGTRAR